MAELSDYHDALDAFLASPSESTKGAVLVARAKLPDVVSGPGTSTSLPNGSTLEAMLTSVLDGALKSSPSNRRRLIRTGVSHG